MCFSVATFQQVAVGDKGGEVDEGLQRPERLPRQLQLTQLERRGEIRGVSCSKKRRALRERAGKRNDRSRRHGLAVHESHMRSAFGPVFALD